MRRKIFGLRCTCRSAKIYALMLSGILTFVGTAVSAEPESYSFLISGYPAKNERSSLASATSELETGTLSLSSAASQFDTRFRTARESAGIALRSDKFCYFGIIIR